MTQATIGRTICMSGYTKQVRPAEGITEPEKVASMDAYGDGVTLRDSEYDHLVPLELGGAVNDPRNLWPEPGASPNPKDSVENVLRAAVCDGDMPLARAQRVFATNWVAWARSHNVRHAPPPRAAVPPPRAAVPPARGRAPASGPDLPVSKVNCSDFSTHAAAQQWFQRHGGSPTDDVAGLDGDHDGSACESLP